MIELEVLGPPRVKRDGVVVHLPPKPLALLAYLCLTEPRGFHRRETLLHVFWPGTDPARARAALRNLLSAQRQALGDGVIQTRGDDEVGLDFARITCDARRFDRAVAEGDLEQAVELYQGRLLKGFHVNDTPDFEYWLDAQQAPRGQAYSEALEQLASRALAGNEPTRAAGWLRRLFLADPTDPRATVLLMQALEAAGDRAEAIRIGEQHARAVRRELEAEPEPRIVAMLDRLRSNPASMETPHLPAADTPERATAVTEPLDHDPDEPVLPGNLAAHLQKALGPRYELKDEIGRGGMSRVFLARDLKLGRDVAVKVLLPELSATIATERFLSEIEILASLKHPNILPLFDAGEAGRSLYYLMPHVDGESLRDRVRRQSAFKLEEAIGVARDVARALDHAHRHGLVHRDIKPENILLADDNAIVADFGIAKAIDASGGTGTEPGLAIGTPMYMSPEQASGSAALDGRSDVYALGCVVYEMLAGEPPFTGPNARAIIARHMQEPPPSLAVVRPDLPAASVAVVEKALAKSPAGRFDSASELVDALTLAASGEPQPPRGASVVTRAVVSAAVVVTTILALNGYTLIREASPSLDPNRIMVFPLTATDARANAAGTGWGVALAVEAALEHSQPLRWLDGWTWLPDSMRGDPRLITPEMTESIARRRRAAFYIDGSIRNDPDSVAVTLRLHDVRGDSLVAQRTATGPAEGELTGLALTAIETLIPVLVAPRQSTDLRALTGRDVGAFALFVQGEREYRQSRYQAALELYTRAVERDSLFAFAAMKASWSAAWTKRDDEALAMLERAFVHDTLLPGRLRTFGTGMRAYLRGDADSAVASFSRALSMDRDWDEAAQALGETYYHLLPSGPTSQDLAVEAFESAVGEDSLFVAPLFHLTEIAIRDRDTARARTLLRRIRHADPESDWILHLQTMHDCIVDGAERFAWSALADSAPGVALLAGRALAASGAHTDCASAAFRTVMNSSLASRGNRWASLVGLQSVLMATGQYEAARVLLDSAKSAGSTGVYWLQVLNTHAGAPFDKEAETADELARRAVGDNYERAGGEIQWLLGVWRAQRGDSVAVARLIHHLQSATSESLESGISVASSLEAHQLAYSGHLDVALARLTPVRSPSPSGGLMWDMTAHRAADRLLRAELLLALEQYDQAARAAATFDHQEPVLFLPFLPRSLRIRMEAAAALGQAAAVQRYRERLQSLGWGEARQPPRITLIREKDPILSDRQD